MFIQPAQVLLFLVISVLSFLLTLCGIQVYFILKEIRESVKKINKMLDDMELISSSVAKPISGFSEFIMGIRKGLDTLKGVGDFFENLGNIFSKSKISNNQEKPQENDRENINQDVKKEEKSKPRLFFKKSGKQLK